MMYMPIIDILKPQGRELFEEYASKGVVPLAYEVCWDDYTPQVEACMRQVVAGGSKLWVNSLWDSLCGGLSDDKAFTESPDEVYGRLLDMGRFDHPDRPARTADPLPRSAGTAQITERHEQITDLHGRRHA